MGSRYGGLKQIDPVDEQGHIIMDFSIYDARRAGFEEVIFIIKKENEQLFREAIGDRISQTMKVHYAFQELTDLPVKISGHSGRNVNQDSVFSEIIDITGALWRTASSSCCCSRF